MIVSKLKEGELIHFEHGFWFDRKGNLFGGSRLSIIKHAAIYWAYQLRAMVIGVGSRG